MNAPDPIEQAAERIVARFEPLRQELIRTAAVIEEAAKPVHAAMVAAVARFEAQLSQRERR